MTRTPARERLLQAAIALFSTQGVRETTTRQIAERAEVNEVTLFRQFGNKHGLLLAVIEQSEVFSTLKHLDRISPVEGETLRSKFRQYAEGRLQAFAQLPEFMLSVVAEAGRHPGEVPLAHSFTQIDQALVGHLGEAIDVRLHLPPIQIAALLNTLLIGWAVSRFAGTADAEWPGREDFLDSVVELFFRGAFIELPLSEAVTDLDGPLVHALLERARKSGVQDYALLYVLFAAGLSAEEVCSLKRLEQVCEKDRHLLRVENRQVPLNRHILGRAYGSYTNNPLTRYLKTRRDSEPALFLNEVGKPMTPEEVRFRWAVCTRDLISPAGPPAIEQAQQTWYVEMFIRGGDLETLALLTGRPPEQLQPFLNRAREKLALEKALKLDQR